MMRLKFISFIFIFYINLFFHGFILSNGYGQCDYEEVIKNQKPLVYYRYHDPVAPGALLNNLGGVVITNTLPYPPGWSSIAEGAVNGDAGAWFNGIGTRADYDNKLNPWPVFTVEFWAMYGGKQVSPDGYGAVVGSFSYGEKGPRGWFLYANPKGSWEFRVGGEENGVCILSGGKIVEKEWVHLAATYNGSIAQLFINGLLADSKVFYGACPNPDSMKFGIGCRGDDFFPWTGGIDEFALYGQVLSSEQILERTLLRADSQAYEKAVLKLKPLVYFRLNEAFPHNLAENSAPGGMMTNFGYYEWGATPSAPGPRYAGFEPTDTALCLTNGADYLEFFLEEPQSCSTAWTFTGWVKPLKSTAVRQTLLSHSLPGVGEDFSFFIQHGYQLACLGLPETSVINFDLSLQENLWHYLALLVTPTHLTLWVNDGRDSVLKSASYELKSPILQCCKHDRLVESGLNNEGTKDFNFYGMLDEWTLFDRPLSEGEIKNQFYTALGNHSPEIFGIVREGSFSLPHEAKVGETVFLRADAAGSQPLSFKWFCNGELLGDSESSVLEYYLSGLRAVERFEVLVSNALGEVRSQVFELGVLPADTPEGPELFYVWRGGQIELSWRGGVLHCFSVWGEAPKPVEAAVSPLKIDFSKNRQQFYIVLKSKNE